jgi:hypothetical protein
MLIGRELDLGLAVSCPHPRPLDLDATAPERHLPIIVAVPNRGPVRVVLALRAHDLVDLLLQHLGENAEPDADRQRQQSLLRGPDQLAERLLHALRQHGLIIGRLRDRYGLLHGGSSFGLGRSPITLPRGADGPEGPPSPQTSTRTGTTSPRAHLTAMGPEGPALVAAVDHSPD